MIQIFVKSDQSSDNFVGNGLVHLYIVFMSTLVFLAKTLKLYTGKLNTFPVWCPQGMQSKHIIELCVSVL